MEHSYYWRDWHMPWFHDGMNEGVELKDIAALPNDPAGKSMRG